MKTKRYARRAMLVVLWLVTARLAAAQGLRPSPELSPIDVVRAQLTALRDEAVEQGIARAYRFASPDNRRHIGSLKAFKRMLRQRYADMLTQTGATLTLTRRQGDSARVLAELDQGGGGHTAYLFLLSRQSTADCDGCWMTDGVLALTPALDTYRRRI